ncbi:MAG: transcription initiation factor TFIID subunit 11 [Cirrosporium novae-zelandiae]|nr:MAG: transcription initiation factor TFIID subunit 11 [Cirrosporium novae-zelandiae]
MASPPYYPPTSQPSSRKRPSLNPLIPPSSNPNLNVAKRRKTSQAPSASSATHPLRQTSFPQDDAISFSARSAARSPSIDDIGSVAGSSVAGGTGSLKGTGRGSRPKKGRGKGGAGDGASVAGSKSGQGQQAQDGEEEEDEGEEEGGLVEGEGVVDKEAERKNLAILVESFTADQAERYDLFKRTKLKKEVVRRITNQTLSQSVPPSVITTINGYTKVFIGELIEMARSVQEQRQNFMLSEVTKAKDESKLETKAKDTQSAQSTQATNSTTETQAQKQDAKNTSITTETPTSNPRDPEQTSAALPPPEDQTETQDQQPNNQDSTTDRPLSSGSTIPDSQPHPPPKSEEQLAAEKEAKRKEEIEKERSRGPLLPEHFREALRRYKKNGEGGGVGFAGLSLELGVDGAGSARLGGKRLFR